jgi:hypothetical protein
VQQQLLREELATSAGNVVQLQADVDRRSRQQVEAAEQLRDTRAEAETLRRSLFSEAQQRAAAQDDLQVRSAKL